MKYVKLWWLSLTFVLIAATAILTYSPGDLSVASPGEPVLIIDAGHGGEDGGAVAPDGTKESDLNLDIALRLEALAAFWGLDTVMTRRTDAIDYPSAAQTLSQMKKADQNARLDMINTTPGGILLSIHQNIYPASSPWGIQVFYGPEPGGDSLAAKLQENLTDQLCPENRRVAEAIDDGIYLMRKAQCPSVLVECGFLSNPGELEKLETPDYRMKLAVVMIASCLDHLRGTII